MVQECALSALMDFILIFLVSVRLAKINAKHALMGHLATFVKKLLLSKTQENSLFVLVQQAPIQLQTMIVRIAFQIVKLVQMEHPVTLVSQLHLRLWHEYFQIVIALLFM
jgi:hypothetical protein